MGIRFQIEPGGSHNDIILHANFLDTNRLQQQEAIGILGVNLIHAAFTISIRERILLLL